MTPPIPAEPEAREALFVRLLLGDLPDERREAVETDLFFDDDAAEELRATADDLIDAYLGGRLTRDDRRRFERYFLTSSRHRERFELVRDLRATVARAAVGMEQRAPPPRENRPLWIAAGLSTVAIGLLYLRLSGPVPLLRSPPGPPASPAVAAASPEAASSPPDAATTARVRLPAEAATIDAILSPATRSVRFEVPPPAERPSSWRIELRSGAGRTVWRSDRIARAAGGGPLVVEIPAVDLAATDYELAVIGEEVRPRDDEAGAGSVVPVERRWIVRIAHRP